MRRDGCTFASPVHSPRKRWRSGCTARGRQDTCDVEARERAAFIAEARTWLGTPFRDQGDVKGKSGAVDCAMLLVRSAQACGLIDPAFDPRPYPPQWHLHRDEERFLDVIGRLVAARGRGGEIPNEAGLPAEALAKPGDVIVWRVGRCFSHGGIIVEATPSTPDRDPGEAAEHQDLQVLHAYYKTGHVAISPLVEVELVLLPDGRPRPFKLYGLWAKFCERRTRPAVRFTMRQ
ncbi:MAG TPA: hypothetical protein VKR31_01670 [Rhizomicrobium sp.]|nr:hypothetical protein [Rhizomicrobium sp.]